MQRYILLLEPTHSTTLHLATTGPTHARRAMTWLRALVRQTSPTWSTRLFRRPSFRPRPWSTVPARSRSPHPERPLGSPISGTLTALQLQEPLAPHSPSHPL